VKTALLRHAILPLAATVLYVGVVSAQGLTAVAGIKVGHHTLAARPTGCTVILIEGGAVGGVDVRGGAPGTRETDLLRSENSVQRVHAVVLSGGSAFGLDAAAGTVRYLDERHIGFAVGTNRVPIVPSAILYDLGVGDDPSIRPGPECGYEAARSATNSPPTEGNVGAGAGATVGKLRGMDRAMKSGVGTASITLDNGITIAALVVVNAIGDVIDPNTNAVVAGVRTIDGSSLLDARELLRDNAVAGRSGENTTIAVVATNAAFSKAEVNKIAQMAHDGLARTIYPVHTPFDGDAVFSLATGTHQESATVLVVGALAADVLAEAVLRAVRAANGIPGLPAAADLPGRSR